MSILDAQIKVFRMDYCRVTSIILLCIEECHIYYPSTFAKNGVTYFCLYMDVDFTDKVVKMVLLAGLADDDVKKEILANDKLGKMSLEQTISTVQIREQARRSFTNVHIPASSETP